MNQLAAIPLEFRLAGCLVLGALLGGFVNFGIYRFAWHKRLVSPWSPAPQGAAPRTWADRLPIVGWLHMRRESDLHGAGFWIRPMLIELATAAGLALLYVWEIERLALFDYAANVAALPVGRTLETVTPALAHWPLLSHIVLITLMLIATFIDIDEKTIPDQVTLTGTLAGLAMATFFPWSRLPGMTYAMQAPPFSQYAEFLHIASPLPWPNLLDGGPPNYSSLLIAVACLWLWSFALLPRTWHGRYGARRAMKYFVARITRDRFSWLIFAITVAATACIGVVWLIGGRAWQGLLSALVGMATGMVVIWAVRLLGQMALRKEAMGFGDVTLMAMIGAFLGWQSCLIVFFIAPLAGLVIGILQFLVNRDNVIPYGPFLCLAALVTVVRWATIWDYLRPAFQMGWLIPAVMVVCMGLMAVLLFVLQAIKFVLWRQR